MNKLNIELTNCFGIDSLKHEFDFGKLDKHYDLIKQKLSIRGPSYRLKEKRAFMETQAEE